jgi:hypothetical protein
VSDERRRHVRHKLNLSPTIVVDLGPNNGGNLIDISGGGLSLQAVARLNPEVELNLHFRLLGMEQPIQTAGCVTWLGPTQKVAGISFKNLPGTAEQQIVEWIARQERPTQDDPSTEPDDSPLPLFPTSLYRFSPRESIELPPDKSLESPPEHSEPPAQPAGPLKNSGGLSLGSFVLRKSPPITLPDAVFSASGWAPVTPERSSSQSRWRRRIFAIAVVSSILGILALILIAVNLNKPIGNGQATPPSPGVGWADRVKAFFGVNAPPKMDPAKAGVPVWAVQRNGYFYCADDPNFKKLQPGAIMTQGDALQSGYQPKVGYCQ